MSKLEEAAKEYLEDHVCSRPNCSYDAFKAGALYQAEQAKVLEEYVERFCDPKLIVIDKKAEEALKKYRESKGGGL